MERGGPVAIGCTHNEMWTNALTPQPVESADSKQGHPGRASKLLVISRPRIALLARPFPLTFPYSVLQLTL